MELPGEGWIVHQPPNTIVIHLTRPSHESPDEWCLDHPYVIDHADDTNLRVVLANFERLAEACRDGADTRETATQLNLRPDQLVSGIDYAHLRGYLEMGRDGDRLTVTTTGAIPTLAGRRLRTARLNYQYDPQGLCLRLPDISQRPPAYDLYRLPPSGGEQWALDSRYSHGTWGQLLGPTANRLLALIAAELRDPAVDDLAIRPTAAALRITPRRLHAELDELHRHGIVYLDHDHGALATSGQVRAVTPELLAANPLVAISHRTLSRSREALAPSIGL